MATQVINLLGDQKKGLQTAIDAAAGYMVPNIQTQQSTLQQLLAAYDPAAYEQQIREQSIQQAGDAQQKMLAQASTKAGSAFNTAAQAAAQQATARAVTDINATAADKVASYKQGTLSNILDQYGNFQASYQNLLEQLSGGQAVIEKEKKKSKWGAALSLAGGAAGAYFGGAAGGALGAQLGGSAGELFS